MTAVDVAVWAFTIAAPVALCAVGWHTYLELRALRRYRQLLAHRNQRVAEDVAWRFRTYEYLLARRLHRARVAPMADALLAQTLRLVKGDER